MLHLAGPNGIGKTSLMRVLCGLARAEHGKIYWGGQSIDEQTTSYRQNIAWLGHRTGLKGGLTLRENLQFDNALARGRSGDELEQVLASLSLSDCADLPASALSAGQQRRAALARIVIAHAPLWFLDEPFTNLDQAGIDLVTRYMCEHAQAGGTVVFAAHSRHSLAYEGMRTLSWDAAS